jgi:hypothetical protein
MDLSSALADLDRGQIVEVVHLLSRHLAEGRDREALRGILAMDARGGIAVKSAVMKLAEEIESDEGRPIQALDPETRSQYLNLLDVALRKAVGIDKGDVGAALARLRQAS